MGESWEIPGTGTQAMETELRGELLSRKERLASAAVSNHPEAARLLVEVDAALERLDGGSWGACDRCDAGVEADRLRVDPLVRVCLGCLTPAESQALERDLELAASIQSALLPDSHVVQDGWEIAFRYLPHGPVSGDHVDVLTSDGEQEGLHVALGDVSGKGVAAALLMSHLHAALRSLVRTPQPLEAIVTRANRMLAESTLVSSYATMLLARLSPEGGVELSNAGHCPPILVRGDNVCHLPDRDLPLGMMADTRFGRQQLQLDEGDMLVLYSDGLSESSNGGDEHLGAEAIAETVLRHRDEELERILDASIELSSSFAGSNGRSDDLTLLAVRRVRS